MELVVAEGVRIVAGCAWAANLSCTLLSTSLSLFTTSSSACKLIFSAMSRAMACRSTGGGVALAGELELSSRGLGISRLPWVPTTLCAIILRSAEAMIAPRDRMRLAGSKSIPKSVTVGIGFPLFFTNFGSMLNFSVHSCEMLLGV